MGEGTLGHTSPTADDSQDLSYGKLPLGLAPIPEYPHLHHIGIHSKQIPVMDFSRLAPESLESDKKQKAIKDARDMAQLVLRNCERSKTAVPPYDFLELIGKGGSAVVYKCKDRRNGDLVAIKILFTDEIDYAAGRLDRDDTIRDFRKEVSILRQLKDSNAKNVNMIHEAFDLQDQLWIVSDYCTGGSVRTLMRAQPPSRPGLEDQYIVPIARELALAIKGVHDIGIIHRDIKCTNVYVTEEGDIQLGDFGIVGILDDGDTKRRTIIGTPHYMPLEMARSITQPGNQAREGYGREIDIWSFGCSVYEMATGLPPNARTQPHHLGEALSKAPRLEGGNYSQELRDFVAFCLNNDPQERPTAEQVLRHPYISNTQKRHPTKSLVKLIHQYKSWEYGGGWRQSLFYTGGAPSVATVAGNAAQDEEEDADDWNFSTSDGFNEAFGRRYSQMVALQDSNESRVEPPSTTTLPPIITEGLTPLERLRQEHKERSAEISASRGEQSLGRLWDPESEPYDPNTPIDDPMPMASPRRISDLPLREQAEKAPTRESTIMIDLDSAEGMDIAVPSFNFDFGDAPTIKAKKSSQPTPGDEEDENYQYEQSEEDRDRRATLDWTFPVQKRATMDWSFPKNEPKEPQETDASMILPSAGDGGELPPGFRPKLKHTATEPIGQFRDFIHAAQPLAPASGSPIRDSISSMIDLDLGLADPADIVRPSTATSATGSTMTDMTSGNPFDLEEDPEQNEIDRDRFSYHKQWQSEGGQVKRSSRRSIPMHTRGSSLTSTDSDLDRPATSDDDVFRYQYRRKVPETMRSQINGTLPLDTIDMNQWPDFGPHSGYDEPRSYADEIEDRIRERKTGIPRTQGHSYNTSSDLSTTGTIARDEVSFPRLTAPHPAALLETSNPLVVSAELDRLLDDFGESLIVTSRALQQHTGNYDDEEDAESQSGLDSSAARTGDEEGF